MAEDRQQSSTTDVKTTQISKKVWNLEGNKSRVINQFADGVNYKDMMKIREGETFISVNGNNKKYIYGRFQNRFYNLITGDEI